MFAIIGISMDIYESQITALLGHNGAGKSTLINILNGMTRATQGFATVYGMVSFCIFTLIWYFITETEGALFSNKLHN